MSEQDSQSAEMRLIPVGVVHSELTDRGFRPDDDPDADRGPIANRDPDADRDSVDRPETRSEKCDSHRERVKRTVAEIEIHSEYADCLDGIEAFSHILVLYWPHRLESDRRGLRKVHPMGRKDIPLQGIYATRSPARPNPVLVSAVRLLERRGNVLRVQGLDALDASPVVDLKPVIRHNEGVEQPDVPDWIRR
jgi:tRNA-Thr(GGU) m(6)t(6)A37 methyltransferase TsaA